MNNKPLYSLLILIANCLTIPTFAQKLELAIPTGHNTYIKSIACSANGKLIATCGLDRKVIVWDRKTGNQLRTFIMDGEDIPVADFSPSSDQIAIANTARNVNCIKVYELNTGTMRFQTGSGCRATGIHFTKDGRFLMASGWGKYFSWFDAQTGKPIKERPAPPLTSSGSFMKDYLASSMDVSPDDQYYAMVTTGSRIGIIQNPTTSTSKKTDFLIEDFKDEVKYCKWAEDGRFLLAQDNSGLVKCWSSETKQVIWTSTSMPKASIYSLQLSPEQGTFTLVSQKTIYAYDTQTGEKTGTTELLQLPKSESWIAISNGSLVAKIGIHEEKLAVIESCNSRFKPCATAVVLEGKIDNGERITTSKTDFLIGNFKNCQPKIWNLQTSMIIDAWSLGGKSNARPTTNNQQPTILMFNSDHTKVLTQSGIFELKKSANSKNIPLSLNLKNLRAIDWSADEQWLVQVSEKSSSQFEILNTKTLNTKYILHPKGQNGMDCQAAKISPDNKTLILSWEGGEVLILNLTDGTTVNNFNTKKTTRAFQFTTNGANCYMFIDGTPVCYQTQTWKPVTTFPDNKNQYGSALSLSPNGAFLLAIYSMQFETDKCNIHLFDTKTGKLIRQFKGHFGFIQSISWLSDGQHFASSSTDNTIRFWDKDKETELFQFFSFKSSQDYKDHSSIDWIAVTPDGRFEGTPKGMEKLYFVKGLESIPLGSMFEKLYTPGIVMQLLGGKSLPPTPDQDINLINSPPTIKIGVPNKQRNLTVDDEMIPIRHYTMATDKINLTLETSAPNDKIVEIRLFQNGKLLNSTTRNLTVEQDLQSIRFDIQLEEGENKFTAIAINSQRTESQPDHIIVVWHAPKNTTITNEINLYLVVVGINNYKNPKYNLNYATADASDFLTAIQKNNSLFNKINTIYLNDEKATKSNITSELDKIKKIATPKDVFLFYYAGHGVIDANKNFYLVPHDVTQLYGNDDALAQKGISAAEMQVYAKEIKAQKQLFILDACQSAGVGADLRVSPNARGAAEEKAIAQLARATGTHWLTASGSEQFASEFDQLHHGAFTYVLLEGLKGKADATNDQKITVTELNTYLQEQVPDITAKYRGSPQYPQSFSFGNDFPIIIIK
jgi:WD40 repeat protein